MLGDIDTYVIACKYDVGTSDGQRVSDILYDYYFNNEARINRLAFFAEEVGLGKWDGENFSNEKKWLKHYKKELRNNICFQVFSLTSEKITSIWLPLKIWFGGYKKNSKKGITPSNIRRSNQSKNK